MLVLSRKRDQKIVLPGLGEIVVVEIRGDKVRLGFNFLKEIIIHREEVIERIAAAVPRAAEAAEGKGDV